MLPKKNSPDLRQFHRNTPWNKWGGVSTPWRRTYDPPALKSPQVQMVTKVTSYTSPDKASNTVPVGSGGEAPPDWCSVQQLSHDYSLVDRM